MKDCEIIYFVAEAFNEMVTDAFNEGWILIKREMKCVKCGDPTDEVVQCTECGDNWCPDCYEAFSPQWFHIEIAPEHHLYDGSDNVDACPKHGPDFKGVG